MISWWFFFYSDRLKNRGLRHGSGKKGGLRHGSGSKKGGVLGTGQVKKGVFTAAHTCTGHICECPPPPPPGCIVMIDREIIILSACLVFECMTSAMSTALTHTNERKHIRAIDR